jgi:hypothetical protein
LKYAALDTAKQRCPHARLIGDGPHDDIGGRPIHGFSNRKLIASRFGWKTMKIGSITLIALVSAASYNLVERPIAKLMKRKAPASTEHVPVRH